MCSPDSYCSNIWSICLKVLSLVPNPSGEVCLYFGLPWDFNASPKQPVRKQQTQIIPSPVGTIQLHHICISHKHLNVFSPTSTPLFFHLHSPHGTIPYQLTFSLKTKVIFLQIVCTSRIVAVRFKCLHDKSRYLNRQMKTAILHILCLK